MTAPVIRDEPILRFVADQLDIIATEARATKTPGMPLSRAMAILIDYWEERGIFTAVEARCAHMMAAER